MQHSIFLSVLYSRNRGRNFYSPGMVFRSDYMPSFFCIPDSSITLHHPEKETKGLRKHSTNEPAVAVHQVIDEVVQETRMD